MTGQVLILAAFGWLLLYGTQHYAFFSNLLLWTGVVLLGVAGGRLAYRIYVVQSSQQRSASKQTAAGPSLAPPTLIQFAEKWSPFAIIGLGFWLRLIALDTLPTFVDEGIHLAWTRLYAANNNNFGWLADGRPLLIVTLAQLQMIGPGALWLGRASIAVFASLSVAACIAIGAALGSRRTGLLAGLIYALLPLAVFHERQVLADPLSAAFGSMGLALMLRMASSERRPVLVPLAGAMAAAILFKFNGVLYLAALPWAVLLLPDTGRARRRLLIRLAAAVGLMSLAIILFLVSFEPRLGANTGPVANLQNGFVGCPPLICQRDLALQLQETTSAVQSVWDVIPPYVGWPLVLLAIVGFLTPTKVAGRPAKFLGLTALTLLVGLLLTAKGGLPPRYLLPLAVPTVVLASRGVRYWLHRLGSASRQTKWLRAGAAVVLAGLCFWPFADTARMIAAPQQANLTAIDAFQYVSGPFAGTGFGEAARTIAAGIASSDQPPVVLVDHFLVTTMQSYFDLAVVDVRDPVNVSWSGLTGDLRSGRHVYLIDVINPSEAGQDSLGTIALYPREGGTRMVRVRLFADTRPDSLRPLFEAVFAGTQPDGLRPLSETKFGRLEWLQTDYESLVGHISQLAAPITLFAYPNTQLHLLQILLGDQVSITAIDTGDQSWDTSGIISTLDRSLPSDVHLEVVYLQVNRLDPQRIVETWLNAHLNEVGEHDYGVLRLVEYRGRLATP